MPTTRLRARVRSKDSDTRLSANARAWLADLRTSGPTTSNVHGGELAFQRWYRFKEAFSPRFVSDIVHSLGYTPTHCTDPFGGSGTTALTCQFLGVPSTTIEVNPFLADLIESKLATYDVSKLIASRGSLAAAVNRPRRALLENELFRGAPATFVEPGVDDRWIFDSAIAQRIAAYRDAIAEVKTKSHRRLFRVLLGATLIPVSNVLISGKGRRYRAKSAQQQAVVTDVDRLFEEGFQRVIYDLHRYRDRASVSSVLRRGDARAELGKCEPTDLVLFSPPYPNSFDYTDIYNVELWSLGYLTSSANNRSLRESTLRSHVQIKRDFTTQPLESRTLNAAGVALDRVRDRLWNIHLPEMIRAYFGDLATILESAARILSRRGSIAMVVGDSRYAGVRVDVPKIVAELAPSLGLRCVERREVRSMRASAQQGGDLALGESLVRLQHR